MDYAGVVITESLKDKSIFKDLIVIETKIEPVTKKHNTPLLKQWTLNKVQIPESEAEKIAELISNSFENQNGKWYADYKNDKYHFIIFPNKIFKVDLRNPILYQKAKQHGIGIGIPEYQVDFTPEDKT